MDKSLYRLEFRSNVRSITFNTYMNMNTNVTLSTAVNFYNFRDNDILDGNAVKYYACLEPDVKLVKFREAPAVSEVPSVPAKVSRACHSVKAQSAQKEQPADEYTPGAVPPSVLQSQELVEDITVSEENSNAKASGDSKESELKIGGIDDAEEESIETDTSLEMSPADLCEYLDLHYTDEQLRENAKKWGINLGNLKRKDSMISKIVRERYDDALTLVKK